MTVYTEGMHANEFLVSEAEGTRSREQVIVSSVTALVPGAVLGKIPGALGAYGPYSPTSTQGATTASAILFDKVDLAAGSSVAASGEIVFSVNPSADDTVTIGGTAVTAKASGATGAQFNIGASLAASMTALATVLNASADAQLAKATYTATGNSIKIVFDTAGTSGNSFTIAASAATPSAATLLGGGTGDRAVIYARDCEVNAGEITWFSGATAQQKLTGIAQLAAQGIIARTAV